MAADQKHRTVLPFPGRREGEAIRPSPEILTFEEALAENLDALYATALRLTRDPGLAEDLVQDVSLRAYRGFRDLRSRERFRSWLFTILVNTAKNQVRSASRRVPFVDVDLDTLLEDPLLADGGASSPESILTQQCLTEDLEAALEALPEPLLRVLWLVNVQDFTIAEVAAILGIPAGTAASRLHRARRAVRGHLEASARRRPGGEGGAR
jgi:RNA polymerase sigma-70 factor (ECF subfamily)